MVSRTTDSSYNLWPIGHLCCFIIPSPKAPIDEFVARGCQIWLTLFGNKVEVLLKSKALFQYSGCALVQKIPQWSHPSENSIYGILIPHMEFFSIYGILKFHKWNFFSMKKFEFSRDAQNIPKRFGTCKIFTFGSLVGCLWSWQLL